MAAILYAINTDHLVTANMFRASMADTNARFICPNCHQRLVWIAETQPHEKKKKPHKAYFRHVGKACEYSNYIKAVKRKKAKECAAREKMYAEWKREFAYRQLGAAWACRATHE